MPTAYTTGASSSTCHIVLRAAHTQSQQMPVVLQMACCFAMSCNHTGAGRAATSLQIGIHYVTTSSKHTQHGAHVVHTCNSSSHKCSAEVAMNGCHGVIDHAVVWGCIRVHNIQLAMKIIVVLSHANIRLQPVRIDMVSMQTWCAMYTLCHACIYAYMPTVVERQQRMGTV